VKGGGKHWPKEAGTWKIQAETQIQRWWKKRGICKGKGTGGKVNKGRDNTGKEAFRIKPEVGGGKVLPSSNWRGGIREKKEGDYYLPRKFDM